MNGSSARGICARRIDGIRLFVAVVSVLGLALGVATLIVVLSVMNGFQREIRSRILSVSSHATMMGLEGNLSNWQTVQREVLKQPGVVAAAPYIEEQAMLANGAHIDGAVVRGILPEQEKTADGLSQRVTEGTFSDLKAGEYNTILGKALAKDLNVHLGGSVVLIAPEESPHRPASFRACAALPWSESSNPASMKSTAVSP